MTILRHLQALILVLLVLYVPPDHRFVSPYGRDKVPPRPEALANKIPQVLTVHPSQVNRALPLMYPTTCDTAYFGGFEISM